MWAWGLGTGTRDQDLGFRFKICRLGDHGFERWLCCSCSCYRDRRASAVQGSIVGFKEGTSRGTSFGWPET